MHEVRIGIFDSGIGGLTVLKRCSRLLPGVSFYYYGDNFRAPYGGRTEEEIGRFVREGMDELAACGICAAVLACNTATVTCIEEIRARYPFPVLGMEPAVKPAAARYRDILVLATPRTAESERMRSLVRRFPSRHIEVCALPELAGAIEAYVTRNVDFTIFNHLPRKSPQAVVLGCTHYPFFRREIADFYGCETFDGGEGTARRLRDLLNLGTDDHFCTQNPNNCLIQNCNNSAVSKVQFIGKAQQINEKAYSSNICFNLE